MTIDTVDLLNYLMAIIGFLIVYVLNGVKSEIKDIKVSVGKLENDLRGNLTQLDRRMTTLETKCTLFHQMDDTQHALHA
jgi:hypothetical protein